MNKQEEIQKGIDRILVSGHAPLIPSYIPTYITKEILDYLHSQSVVIEVEGKLPSVEYAITAGIIPDELMIIEKAYRKSYAGYVAVEPLIKEGTKIG